MNIAQGAYGLGSPQEYSKMAGDIFVGSSDKALQSIGGSFLSRLRDEGLKLLNRSRINWRRLVSVGLRVPEEPVAHSCYDPHEIVLCSRDVEMGEQCCDGLRGRCCGHLWAGAARLRQGKSEVNRTSKASYIIEHGDSLEELHRNAIREAQTMLLSSLPT
jgi:hypothetical protein